MKKSNDVFFAIAKKQEYLRLNKLSHNTSKKLIEKELKYSCKSYNPIPVVLCRGEGVFVWDTEGKKYYDHSSGSSANNFGHCHPKIIETLCKQAGVLHHTSRAFYNDILCEYSEKIANLFGYNKSLPMNTGVEAGDTACKLARKWGYKRKGIRKNQARIIFAAGNFWGRSLAAISASTDPLSFENYEPLLPGFSYIPYNDLVTLEKILKDPNICAFMMEPIQGDAGIIVPNDGYCREVRKICTKYNVLWIADEIQTGIGRTGKRLAVDYEHVKPDILVLGKALGGGVYPVSAILADNDIMNVITPGTHGSTFGGNPLGSKVALTALEILEEEKLSENSFKMGEIFRKQLRNSVKNKIISIIRGKGLMNGVLVDNEYATAWDVCLKLKENGLLAKITHNSVIRLSPPLIINEKQIEESVEIIAKTINSFSV